MDYLARVQVLRQNSITSCSAGGLNDQSVPQRQLSRARGVDCREDERRVHAHHVKLGDSADRCGGAFFAERLLQLPGADDVELLEYLCANNEVFGLR